MSSSRGPYQLDRRARLVFGDRCRFHHRLVVETPSKTTADAREMERNVAFFHSGLSRCLFGGTLGRLRRSPDLELAVFQMSRRARAAHEQ